MTSTRRCGPSRASRCRDAETVRELVHSVHARARRGDDSRRCSRRRGRRRPTSQGSSRCPDGQELARQFLSSPNHLARSLFESPEVQTWIGFWVAQLAGTGDVFGLGANYPVMLAGSTAPYGWGDLRRRLGEARRGDGGVSPRPRRRGAGRRDRAADRGLGRSRARAVVLDTGERISVEGHARLEPRPEAHVPRARRATPSCPPGVPPARRALALRRHVDVLLLPGARRAGALEGSRVRPARSAVLRGVDVRDARPARRQRVRLPARDPASQPGPVLGASVSVRAEPRTRGQGGLLRRADRSLRAARGRLRRLGGAEGAATRTSSSSRWREYAPASSRRTWSAATSRARSTSSASCRA